MIRKKLIDLYEYTYIKFLIINDDDINESDKKKQLKTIDKNVLELFIELDRLGVNWMTQNKVTAAATEKKNHKYYISTIVDHILNN